MSKDVSKGYGTISVRQRPTIEDAKKDELASQYEGNSSVLEATFNFINSLIGAGIVGYAWAIATAGGLVSVVAILMFAVMNKYAFDLVVALSVETEGARGSFENLGAAAYGNWGRRAVVTAKGLFIFGCLVIYNVIFKDNFAPAAYHLLYSARPPDGILAAFLRSSSLTTAILSTSILLPLCLLRSVQPLARFSVLKLCIFLYLVGLVICLYIKSFAGWNITLDAQSFKKNWLAVHPRGLVASLGTYLFSFTAQHAVHIIYQSLAPEVRNLSQWRKVSTWSTVAATVVSLVFGLFAYMTFWETSDSNMFSLYRPSPAIDIARILLSLSSLLTFPLPFFSLRELLILSFSEESADLTDKGAATKSLPAMRDVEDQSTTERFRLLDRDNRSSWWLIPGEETQLILPCHLALTGAIYFTSLFFALYARSLGDVLNLIGCATGTGNSTHFIELTEFP